LVSQGSGVNARLLERARRLAAESHERSDWEELMVFRRGSSLLAFRPDSWGEVVRLKGYTPIPTLPPHVAGVFNLRGSIVPLLDLSYPLKIEAPGPLRVAMVTLNRHGQFGIGFDSLEGTMRVPREDVTETPPDHPLEGMAGDVMIVRMEALAL